MFVPCSDKYGCFRLLIYNVIWLKMSENVNLVLNDCQPQFFIQIVIVLSKFLLTC